uniref:Uncharacterized protein n=1 Tax=Phaeomonas parva TaxID=124430 RepID=A0A7S1TTA7_9STRA|mmetsp:Transcript_14874/g.44817  ORF Transcript_14874/g.44817 Transcript_14874/m.44817 type:complete len:239 (+) Transcript_14874:182-898(+)
MVCDALLLANDHLRIPGSGGAARRLSECADDMVAYSALGDWLIPRIEHAAEPELLPASRLLRRIPARDLYRFCGEVLLSPAAAATLKPKEVQRALRRIVDEVMDDRGEPSPKKQRLNGGGAAEAAAEEFILVGMPKINYGMKDKDPVKSVHFFVPSKSAANEITLGQKAGDKCSLLTPSAFEEKYLRVYSKDPACADALREAFRRWCARNSFDAQPVTPSRRRRGAFAVGERSSPLKS